MTPLPLPRVETRRGYSYFLSPLSVDSYHCLVFFALSCASKNTFFHEESAALMSEKEKGKKD